MFNAKDLVAFSDRHKREENQDRSFYMSMDGSPDINAKMVILAVLDGVSHSNGGDAAPMAAAAMRPHLAELLGKADQLLLLDDQTKRAEIHQALKRAILSADAHLYRQQCGGLEYGTTITLAVAFDEAIFTANVGDSPAYLFRLSPDGQSGKLLPMFECHNEAGLLVRKGVMTPEEALNSRSKNIIMRMVGSPGLMEDEIYTAFAWMSQSDVLLLGSDGALSVFPEETLANLICQHIHKGLPAVVAALFEKVQSSPSTDNFTVLAQWLETD